MSKFRKKDGKSAPAINTSSLPDIVFMLLFFFMVATTTKEVDPLVKIQPALGTGFTELTPFKQRSEVDFVYLGEPIKGDAELFDKGVAVQYDGLMPKEGIAYLATWKEEKFEEKPDDFTAPRENVITCFKADEKVPMGVIFEARDILQEINFNTIGYAGSEKGNVRSYNIRQQ